MFEYTVLLRNTEEILECNSLKVLYKAVHSRIRCGDKITALFYKNIDWKKGGFKGKKPFFQMGTE